MSDRSTISGCSFLQERGASRSKRFRRLFGALSLYHRNTESPSAALRMWVGMKAESESKASDQLLCFGELPAS